MKKKSQIRKYTVDKVVQLTKTETIPEMLKMYAQHVEDKKNKLKEKKSQLIGQLNQIRKQSQKIVYQMADGVKDRLEKTQQIVMTANSRPSTQTIKQLSDLFAYMQNQGNLINNNSTQTNSLFDLISTIDSKTIHKAVDYSSLDEQFLNLEAQCEKEQRERDKLLAERDSHRTFYNTIKQTIDQYRIKYDIIEGQISQREKQLDHLVSYFKLRQQQDQTKINHQINTANEMQQETLRAQQIYNQQNNRNRNLEMKENQYQSRKLANNED